MAGSAWIWILVVFVVYFIVLIGIAVFRTRQMDDMSDYVLGAEEGAFTSALSAGSSSTSGWTLLGLQDEAPHPVQSTTTGCAMIQRLSIV